MNGYFDKARPEYLPASVTCLLRPDWLIQASRISLHGHGWTATAWLVIVLRVAILTAPVYHRYHSRI